MIRSEIKDFTMNYEKCGSITCSAPVTLFSALKENGLYTPPMNEADAEKYKGYFDSPCEFTSTFNLTDIDVKRKYIYLRFHGIDGTADIYLNDTKLGLANNSHRVWTLDIKGICRVGKNDLRLVFSPEAGYGKVSHQLENEYGVPILDAGISGKVELLKFNNAIIDNITLTETLDGDAAMIHIHLETLGNSDSVKAVATLVSGSGQIYYGGFSRGQGSIRVRNPLYWWPRGLGVQNIYRLTVNLYGEHDIEDTCEYKIGICNLGINSSSSEALATVNGISFMPMGVYYTPADDIISSESDEKITALVIAAAKAGCNTLVVSGSGGFASERLLSACDAHGITVWQELPYVSIGDKPDIDGYKIAVTSALKKMSYHPCLMAVVDSTGIGDMDLLCKNAAPSLSFMSYDDYMKITIASYPAIPCDRTLWRLAPKGSNPLSADMEWHYGENIERMLVDTYKDYLYAENLSDFAYLTRLNQANKMMAYAREERVRRNHGGAAIISRLADSRPTVSDSMVDYFCNPKAIESYAAAFFAPISLIPKVEGSKVSFAVSNERRQSFDGFIYYRILDAENNLIYHSTDDVKVPEMSVMTFDGRDFGDIIAGHENEYYLEYGLREGAIAVTKATLLFVKPKRFAFVNPDIQVQISGVGRAHTMTIKSEAFAKDVEIYFEGMDVILSDNYFDITSSAPIKINVMVTSGAGVNSFDLEEAIRIRCVNTIGKVNKSLKKSRFDAKKQEILESLKIDF